MKTMFVLAILALAAPLVGADTSKILLKGSSADAVAGQVSGAASAVVGDMTIAADVITFHPEAHTLRCEGAVTIRVAGTTVNTHDCTIDLGEGAKRAVYLARGKIELSPGNAQRFQTFPTSATDLIGPAADREKVIRDYQSRLQLGKP